ncbi:MAG: hypothetical protein GTO03_12005 [Planctomycetales bacterium]|nr:hypothetical protein [Planctomycetales bacterium]
MKTQTLAAAAVVVLGLLLGTQAADAQVAGGCCTPTVTYYAPAPTVAYYAPVTTYYAPRVPVTTYYAPSVPVTTYYAPRVPVTTYYAGPSLIYNPTRFWPRRRWAWAW